MGMASSRSLCSTKAWIRPTCWLSLLKHSKSLYCQCSTSSMVISTTRKHLRIISLTICKKPKSKSMCIVGSASKEVATHSDSSLSSCQMVRSCSRIEGQYSISFTTKIITHSINSGFTTLFMKIGRTHWSSTISLWSMILIKYSHLQAKLKRKMKSWIISQRS